MASWAYNIVAAILVFRVSGGAALAVAIVGAAQFVPQLVLGPLSGKLADRRDPTDQIVLGRMAMVAGSGGLALYITLAGGVGKLHNIGPVVAASLVVGLGLSLGGPALQSLVSRLVRENEIGRAVVLNSMPMPIARATGPVLGTLVATTMSPPAAFFACALAGTAHVLIVLRMRALLRGSLRGSTADNSVRAAFRHVRSDAALGALLLGIAAVSVGSDPSITLTPTIAHELGGGDRLVGLLASSFGVGCAAGAISVGVLLRWINHVRLGNLGLVLMAAGLIGLTGVSAESQAVAMFCVSGVGMAFAYSCLTVRVQLRSPPHLRGRLMALWLVAFLGVRPIAAAASGALTDIFSVAHALWASAAVMVISVGLLLVFANEDRSPI